MVNNGSKSVSVLRNNNLFDRNGLSMPLTIRDDIGRKVPTTWIHAMVIERSYLELKPGEVFEREFNLTDYIDIRPESGGIPKRISVTLPSSVPGFEGSSQISNEKVGLPQGVKDRLPPRSITIDSKPLEVQWASYKRSSHFEKRQWTSRGTTVIPGKCTGDSLTAVKTSILDASYLAGAGLNAAANFTELPFRYFFKGDIATSNTVAGVYNRVISSQLGNGELVGVTCEDVFNRCSTGAIVNPGYAAQTPGRAPIIVICPFAFTLPRNPTPCSTKKPGTISLGYLMLHEMTHIASISGPDLDIKDRTGETARDVQDHLDDGGDTTLDANAYAYLGSWSWDMGLGGPPWNQQLTCLENFKTGQFDAKPNFTP